MGIGQGRAVPMALQWSTGTRGRAETLGMGQVRVVPMSLHRRTGTRGGLEFWEGVKT